MTFGRNIQNDSRIKFACFSFRVHFSTFRLSNRTPKITWILTLYQAKNIPNLIVFGTHNLQMFKHNTLIDELLLMQFYLFNIRPKFHHQKWRKLWVTLLVNWRNMHALFSVCSSRHDDVITNLPYMKTETYKLYSIVFWIFLPNNIIIYAYNFELYCFKVGVFWDTV